MNQMDYLRCASVGVLFGLAGCSSNSVNDIDKVEEPTMLTKQTLNIEGLKHCNNANDSRIHLNPDEPLTIIVHGCFASAGRFKTLALVEHLRLIERVRKKSRQNNCNLPLSLPHLMALKYRHIVE